MQYITFCTLSVCYCTFDSIRMTVGSTNTQMCGMSPLCTSPVLRRALGTNHDAESPGNLRLSSQPKLLATSSTIQGLHGWPRPRFWSQRPRWLDCELCCCGSMVERCAAITKGSVSHPVDMRGRCEVKRSHNSLLDTLMVNVYRRSFLEVITWFQTRQIEKM